MDQFLERCLYFSGMYNSETHILDFDCKLKDKAGGKFSNRLLYLSLPPNIFVDVVSGIILFNMGGKLLYLPKDVSMPIILKSREYEVFTEVSVKKLTNGVKFASIGLIKMLNSRGAAFNQWDPGDENIIIFS